MWIFSGLQLFKWLSWWHGQDITVLMFNSHFVLSVDNYCICCHSTVLRTTGRIASAINQVALKALQTARTTSPLVQKCQKMLNYISTQQAVGLYWVAGHAGERGNETTNELARGSSALKFVGPEPALGDSRQDIRRMFRHWLVNQHWVWWRGLGNTQRQAQELISQPCPGAKARFLSLNRTQSRSLVAFLLDIIPWEDIFT
jgi:hypothetical protein